MWNIHCIHKSIKFYLLEKCVAPSEHIFHIFFFVATHTNKMTLVISINDQILYDLFKVLAYYFHYCTHSHTRFCVSFMHILFKAHCIRTTTTTMSSLHFPYMNKI